MPNDIAISVKAKETGLEKIETDARKAGTKVAGELGDGFDKAGRSSEQTRKQISDDLEKASADARRAGAEMGSALTEGISGALDSGSIDPGSTLTGMLGGLGPIGVAGGLIGGALLTGITAEWQEDALGGMIAAQTGQASSEAERLGDVAGRVFAGNFGESMEDVAAAMTAALQTGLVDSGATDEVLQDITEKVITAGEIIGEETKSIARAANQLLVNDLADSATEAIDIITHAGTEGLNVADDLLDTISEYSSQFTRLGLSGDEALGLISQALQGGARDTDFAADALKEFAIRAQDGSETTARGFRTIGLDAGKMGDAIARGGTSARKALDATLDGLRAIEDPVLRNQAAVDLFGTKAEDLGQALFDMDLDTAAETFGDFEDAADEAAETAAENASLWDKLGRGFSSLAGNIGEATEEFVDFATSDGMRNMAKTAQQLAEFYGQLEGATDGAGAAGGRLADQFEESDDTAMGLVDTLDELISKQRELAGGVIDLSEAQMDWHEAVDNVAKSLEENGRTLDISTEKGRNNQSTLNDLAESAHNVAAAMEEQGYSAEEVQAHMDRARTRFIEAAEALGATETQAREAADAVGITSDALKRVPRNTHARVHAHTKGAMSALAQTLAAVRDIDGRTATVYIAAQQIGASLSSFAQSFAPGRAHGGIIGADEVPRAASGGVRSSTVQINDGAGMGELVELPNGSRVMTAGATRAYAEAGLLGGGGGGSAHVTFDFTGAGPRIVDAFIEILQHGIQQRGGDAVAVLEGRR